MTAQCAKTNTYPQGQCTWWASQRMQQLTGCYAPDMGNAKDWATNCSKYGWENSSTPSAPSVMCFQPGIQLSDTVYGHVAVVESIIDATTVMTSNLNYMGDQKNVQNVQFKTNTPGVSFITNGQGGTTSNPVILIDFMDKIVQGLANSQSAIEGVVTSAQRGMQNFMVGWAIEESGTNDPYRGARWNPLNTTQDEPGATNFNAAGVKSYASPADGVAATIDTLLGNSGYGALVHAIVTDDEGGLGLSDGGMNLNVAEGLFIWVSGSKGHTQANIAYVQNLMLLAGVRGPYIKGLSQPIAAPASSQQAIDKWGGIVLGQGDISGINSPSGGQSTLDQIAGALQGVGTFFGSVNSFFSNPMRIVKIIGGTIILLIGLALAITGLASTQPVKQATKTVAKVAALGG